MSGRAPVFDELIDDAYLEASASAWAYVRAHGAAILERLGLWRQPPRPRPAEELGAALGVEPAGAAPFAWLFEAVAAGGGGRVRREGGGYAPGEPPPAGHLEAAAAAVRRHAAGVGSSIELIEYVAERYPDFLRGERSGPMILLKGRGLELWEAYFSAANPLYQVHNAACARGLRRAIAAIGRPPHVVELGAGTGGGTAGVLAEMAAAEPGRRGRLTITDTAPSFLFRIGERLAGAGVELARRRVDFERPLAEQGLAPGEADVVVAVNALHIAADLPATLDRLAGTLAAGGRLVVSESLCGAGEQVHQDFVFNLLPGSATGGSRFLTAAAWRAAFAASPFEAEIEVNRQGPELALLAVAAVRG